MLSDPSPASATTASAKTSGRSRGLGGAGASRGRAARPRSRPGRRVRDVDVGFGRRLRRHRHRGPVRRHVRRPRRGASARWRGADQEAELALTVEEAYRGGRREISHGRTAATYEVTIPPGVIDGQRIRLAGEGGRGVGDGPAGDLYLVVRLQPHPRFRRDGRDITVDLPVTPWEAALGRHCRRCPRPAARRK